MTMFLVDGEEKTARELIALAKQWADYAPESGLYFTSQAARALINIGISVEESKPPQTNKSYGLRSDTD